MTDGVVVEINVAPAATAPMRTVPEVRVVPGRGLEGDRYFDRAGTWSSRGGTGREVTLVELEAVEGLAREYGARIEPSATRRNVVTRGVALNHLVDREFTVGDVTLRGVRLCEPCEHMERLAGVPKVRAGLVHRGGLRADVVRGGTIRAGDAIRTAQAAARDA